MRLRFASLYPDRIPDVLSDLADLRLTVFREWPYLYDGTRAYEERYLKSFAESPGALLVCAWAGDRLVGAATGTPLLEHEDAFRRPLEERGFPASTVFYCAESVLLPEFRGQGAGHAFFDLREAHARTLGLTHSAFCAVVRPEAHPMRPESYRPLDPFWMARGYRRVPGAIAHYAWQDVGDQEETEKPMQIWLRTFPDETPG